MNPTHKKYILAIVLIIIAGSAVYSNTLHSPFQFDDEWNITNNPNIRDISGIGAIFSFMPTRFITYLSLAVNYQFNSVNVIAYHLFNILAHLSASIMVWWLVLLTLRAPAFKGKSISGHSGVIALFAALIFAVHPVQTQGVTYIIQRATLLAALFYISSLVFYAKSRLLRHKEGALRTQLFYYLLSFAALILAMFSKEMAITLPFAILLYEVSFFKEDGVDWKRVMPFFAALAIIPATMAVTGYVNFKEMRIVTQAGPGILPLEYLMTEFRVLVTYIRLLFIPVNQNLDYDYRISKTLFDIPTLSSLIFLMIILIFAVKIFKKYRLASFGILFFFLALIPESSIIPIKDVIFEHRLYLPMFGYAVFLVSAAYYIFEKKGIKPVIIILSIAALAYSMLAYNRNFVWKDEFTLWNDAVCKSPGKERPYNNRGNAYLHKGSIDQALSDYNRALEIDPGYANAYNNRGNAYLQKGDIGQAIFNYNEALKINPGYADAYNNRGNACAEKNNLDQAVSDYSKAIEHNPKYADAYSNRGNAYIEKGDLDKAIADCNRAIEINPAHAEAYNNRGIVYLYRDDIDRALSDYDKAIRIKPKYADAYFNRGNARMYKGDFDRAMSDYNKAVEFNPRYTDAYNNRGNAYQNKGDFDRAISDYSKAIEISPRNADSYSNRGAAYQNKGDLEQALSDYNKTIDLDPKHAGAYHNRAAIYFKSKRYTESWSDVHKVEALGCKIDPKFIEALKKSSGKEE
jgi:Tfp pilus assembly protein PilF